MSRILVVDDSEQSLVLLKKFLSEEGHEVHVAKEAFAAMESLDRLAFDLLLLDVNMPFRDGFSTLKALKESLRFRALPVAMITARSELRDVKKAMALGADSYIVKPFNKQDLLEKIRYLLDIESQSKKYQIAVDNNSALGKANIQLQFSLEVVELSDSGVVVHSLHPLLEDVEIQLQNPLLQQLGLESAKLQIGHSKEIAGIGFEIRLLFKNLSHDQSQKLRQWILQKKFQQRSRHSA